MITYSAPLVYDKTVYGVLGIEVGVNDLTKFFQVKDLGFRSECRICPCGRPWKWKL